MRLSLLFAHRRLLLLAMMFLFSIFAVEARAQFSGPSISPSTPVNLPIKPTTDPDILYPKNRETRLLAGDVITVHIYGATDYVPQAQVSLDGAIQLPLIGTVSVEGLTLHEAQDRIAQMLVNAGMYRNPQVSIQLIESPNSIVTISGEIHALLPIHGQKRLIDVLSGAGPFPPTASHIITIHRPGIDQPIIVDLGTDPAQSERANVPIFAGDTIIVGRTGGIYVIGAFKNQGFVPLTPNSPLTLMQAASVSGGPSFEGKFNDLRLIRTVGLERKVVHIDIKRVMNGKDPDPVLQADDIVFLPSSLMKSAIKSGGLGTLMGLGSLLVVAARP